MVITSTHLFGKMSGSKENKMPKKKKVGKKVLIGELTLKKLKKHIKEMEKLQKKILKMMEEG